ncbi:MAG: hypothetical protein ACPLXO_02720 [Desulfurella sp.]
MIKRIIKQFIRKMLGYNSLRNEIKNLKLCIGHLCVENLKRKIEEGKIKTINDAEFRIFSQFGEDGIICFLIETLEIPNKIFVEFGVETYEEANTRFLLEYYNYKGLIIEANRNYVEEIKTKDIVWRHSLEIVNEFVTRENINSILEKTGFVGDIALLSIDIDGMDYWIWDAIDIISPRIVICEYNGLFGYKKSIVVPYNPNFDRFKAHYSGLYFGASLKALVDLGRKKGYAFVGCNLNENDAFFVRKDVLANSILKEVSIEEGYKSPLSRQSRDRQGKLTFLSGVKQIKLIEECIVYDLELQKFVRIKEILNEL